MAYINTITTLYYLKEHGAPATAAELTVAFKIPAGSNLSGTLSSLVSQGTVSKKRLAKQSVFTYTLTKKGEERLARLLATGQTIQTRDQIGTVASTASALPPPIIGENASSAIQGITDLIEENQRLHALVKGIELQIQGFYAEREHGRKE